MRFKPLYFIISLMVILPGVYSLIQNGLRPSIDFTGGTLIELKAPMEYPLNSTIIKEAAGDIEISSVQNIGENQVVIRTKPISKNQNNNLQLNIASAAGIPNASSSSLLEETRFETVGPILGQELVRKTIISIMLASAAILGYVAIRFNEIKYGVCAVLAMFHDTIILLGVFSLLGKYAQVEVDTLFVTAVLTTLSFSVHDTIVVYDRIRESVQKLKHVTYVDIVNKAVAETLSRSINNSMTIIFMLLALWLMGGDTIRWFVFALLIGTISGTYSSTFTAAPLLLVWDKLFKTKKSTK